MENANRNVAENREALRVIIEIIIFTSRQNIALRGHDEKLTSNNRELVRCSILTRIKKAGLLSVIIDTTTNVANIEQFSFIIRFVNIHGAIEERLVALEAAADGTGKGLYEKFCEITEKHNIDWKKNLCAQAYDGAAAMQGTYSGLRTFI
ncbi:uncharacterized protein LOC113557758 [Rhopalosiphum maidis]|uniref:uncharacterized protein LOC113557758 n=1 Tax=Rhopalosiphum maidis TaxID=43146 RepID=UPI000F0019ED|nr:uncharacterized protein LOC113557758 [Rhopalosiphum maidis]